MCSPRSLTFRAFTNPCPTLENLRALNDRRFLALEDPAFTGIGQVRATARAYGAFTVEGSELGLRPETLDALTAPVGRSPLSSPMPKREFAVKDLAVEHRGGV